MNYNDLTRRYFESAPTAGELSGAGVFRGAAGRPGQGTWVQFDLQVNAGVVLAARFLAFACPHVIAVSAWLAEQSAGKPLREELIESVHQLRDRFAVPVEKMGRLLTVEDAWRAAAAAAIDCRDSGPHIEA